MIAAVVLDSDRQSLPPELQPWLETVPDAVASPAFRLRFHEDCLRLQASDPGLGELLIDFARGETGYRSARARNERLVRACAAAPGIRIIDATGGLGTDAWLLANAGAEVVIFERHPVVAALLADALRRSAVYFPDVTARIALHHGDSREALAEYDEEVNAIYLDPMYPPRRKRALGDRRLRLLAALFASDGEVGDDVAGLLEAARSTPVPRVVLKRPLRVELPAGVPAPDYSLTGRSTRFDVWRRPPRQSDSVAFAPLP